MPLGWAVSKPKRGAHLPDENHVMRQVPYKLLERDENDQVLGFLPGAFAHRNDEDYLSFGWLEFYGSTHAANVTQCKEAIQAVRKAGRALHGVAQVGCTKALAQHNAKPVRLVYCPNYNNPSHSALFMDHPVPNAACEDLAREFWKEHY